jgi:hypothetical protein
MVARTGFHKMSLVSRISDHLPIIIQLYHHRVPLVPKRLVARPAPSAKAGPEGPARAGEICAKHPVVTLQKLATICLAT